MPVPRREPAAYERLSSLFVAHGAELLAYARRRGAAPADAEDVVAHTFAVAWRRVDDIPAEAARAWLFGVARQVLRNERRAAARRARRSGAPVGDPGTPTAPTGLDADLRAVLDALRPADRELLQLAAWEGMRPADLAIVLGISANAAAIRLHRARQRFKRAQAALISRDDRLKGSPWMRTLGWVKGSLAGRREEVE